MHFINKKRFIKISLITVFNTYGINEVFNTTGKMFNTKVSNMTIVIEKFKLCWSKCFKRVHLPLILECVQFEYLSVTYIFVLGLNLSTS